MKLTVKLFAYFRDDRFVKEVREYSDTITVGEIIDGLDIDRDEVGIMMLNSKHCSFETVPVAGDIVAIFPQVGGG